MSTLVDGKQAFLSIQNTLRRGSTEVRLSAVWRELHKELAIGKVTGSKLLLSTGDKSVLRNHIMETHGIDPLHEEVTGDRITVSEKVTNEKWATKNVFTGRVRAYSRSGQIPLVSGRPTTPARTALFVLEKDICLKHVSGIVVVENGAAFNDWHQMKVSGQGVKDAIAIYRGHDSEASAVNKLLARAQGVTTVYAAVDIDPAGLVIANAIKADAILAPVEFASVELCDGINKKSSYDDQIHQLNIDKLPAAWRELGLWVKEKGAAVTQESMISHGIEIEPLFANKID